MSPHHANAAPADDAPFILLRVPERSERSHRILGCVIPLKNYAIPFQHYRPRLGSSQVTGDDNKKLVALNDKLWDSEGQETVNLTDVLMGKKGAKTKAAMAKVSDLFSARAKEAVGTDVRIEAGHAQHFMCDNVGCSLEEDLLGSPQWKAQVLQLWNSYLHEDHPEFLLVTGVYSCSGVTVSWEKSVEKELRLLAKLPIAEMAGDPEPIAARKLDLGFEMIREMSTDTRVFAKCDDKLVFALAYTEIFFGVEAPPYTGLPWYNPRKYMPNKPAKHIPRRSKATAIKDAWLGEPYYGFGIDPSAEGGISEEEESEREGEEEEEEEEEEGEGVAPKAEEGDRVHIIVPTLRYKKIEDAVAMLPLTPVQSNEYIQDGNVTNGNMTNGNMTNGNMTNGNMTNGNMTNGNMTNGNMTNGNMTNGNMTNGNTRSREATLVNGLRQ